MRLFLLLYMKKSSKKESISKGQDFWPQAENGCKIKEQNQQSKLFLKAHLPPTQQIYVEPTLSCIYIYVCTRGVKAGTYLKFPHLITWSLLSNHVWIY